MTRKLHKAHARAHALGRNALDVFQTLASDLRRAAEGHHAVAETATDQINELSELRYSADQAAAAAHCKADAIEGLLK